MRKAPLSEEQIKQLKQDKEKGISISDLSYKYNIGKSSIYNYLSIKESPSRPNTPEMKNNDNHDNHNHNESSKMKSIDDDNYLDEIFSDFDDDIKQPIKKVDDKEKVTKKGKVTIKDDTKDKKDIILKIPNFLKMNDPVNEDEQENIKNSKKKSPIPKRIDEEEEEDERLPKVNKIINYLETFHEKLDGILPITTEDKKKKYIQSLHKMKTKDLDLQLDTIRHHVGKITSHKAFKLGYLGVIDVVEKLGSKIIDIEGLHKDIETNKQIDEVLKELSCEYDLLSKYTKPEYRLIGLTGFQMFATYKKNKIIKHQQNIINSLHMNKEADENITNKYNDI